MLKAPPLISLDLHYFSYLLTNPRPTPVELIFEHIMRPQHSKAQVLEFLTDVVIIGPTIAF